MDWYRKIKPKRTRGTRKAAAIVRAKTLKHERVRKPLRVRDPKRVFHRDFCRIVWLTGYKSKMCSRYHMAKFFDVDDKTIHRWEMEDVLPPPYMYMQQFGRSYPMFLSAQFRCLVIVVNDLVADGYLSIPWKLLDEHKAMLQQGYAEVRARFDRRVTGPLEETGDKYGVILLD